MSRRLVASNGWNEGTARGAISRWAQRRRDRGRGAHVAPHGSSPRGQRGHVGRGDAGGAGAADRRAPVGVLAAHAAGLTEVILSELNAPDLDDVPSDVREHMHSHP